MVGKLTIESVLYRTHEVNYDQKNKIQAIVNTHLINIKEADLILKPDNFEVEEAIWVPLNKIEMDDASGKFSYAGFKIPQILP